ncbi:hypothetical protein MBLNU457_g0390t2 [Dothideomycetes sp. NU457]
MTPAYCDVTAEHSLAPASEKPPLAAPHQPQFIIPASTTSITTTPQLLKYADLPEWQKEDDKFVESGYRVATPSCARCLASWGYLHNETGPSDIYLPVNIFSHLVGAAVFYGAPSLLYLRLHARYNTAKPADVAVFAVYLFGVAGCYTLSAAFHTLMSHSREGSLFGLKLDFQGIILLIWSATVPAVHFTWYFEPGLRDLYWSLITFCAVLASIVTFTPAFIKPASKPLRVGTYGPLALSSLLSVVHGVNAHGWTEQSRRFPMWGIGLTIVFNLFGAVVYTYRFPERWFRGTFDIFGASHQLMHVSVVIASLAWLAGLLQAFDNVHNR